MPSRCRIPKLSCGSDARLVQPLEHLCLGFGAVPDSTGDAGSISHLQLSALAPFVDHPTLRKATVLLRRNRNEADVASSRVARTTAAFSSRARTISMISIVEAASATTSSDTRSSATYRPGNRDRSGRRTSLATERRRTQPLDSAVRPCRRVAVKTDAWTVVFHRSVRLIPNPERSSFIGGAVRPPSE